jgi:thiamine biosynthesis lipoprotein
MGSEVRITTWAGDDGIAGNAVAASFAAFDRLDALLSVWQSGSDVVRINAAAGKFPVLVSADTLEVLKMARQASEWTGGKFDVTFGALADVWKFDHDRDNRVPTPAEISARLPLIDYTAVQIDEGARTVFLSRAGMRMHLGGIGKGYAVDRAVEIMRAAGLRNFLIQAGGDMYAAGEAGVGPWRLGVSDPRGALNESFATIELRDATLSTSGDYERAFVKNGERYHHVIDPDTGQPARGCVSVTIIAKTATLADVLSTGVFLLGPDKGMALIERLPDVDGIIVTQENQVLMSQGLHGRVNVRRAPTGSRP